MADNVVPYQGWSCDFVYEGVLALIVFATPKEKKEIWIKETEKDYQIRLNS